MKKKNSYEFYVENIGSIDINKYCIPDFISQFKIKKNIVK